MKIEVTVCNVCQGVRKPTTAYTIRRGGEEAVVDLCVDDAAPIEALFPASKTEPVKRTPAKKAPTKKAATPRRRAAAKVVSLDEIEQMKNA